MTRVRSSSQVDPVTPLVTTLTRKTFSTVNNVCKLKTTTYPVIDRTRSLKSVVKTITDVEVHDFHKRRRKGELFFNPLTQTEVTTWQNAATIEYALNQYATVGVCQFSSTEEGTLNYPSEDLVPFSELLEFESTLHSDLVARTEALAVTNAWAAVSAADLNAYASLGELSETISSLVSIFKRLIKIIKAIKRLDLKVLLGELKPKELADRYMEARYAIRPLIYETNAIIGLFNKSPKKPKRVTFRGSSTLIDSKQQTRNRVASSRLTHSVVDYISIEVTSSAGVLTSVDKISWPHLLGFTEPLEAAWELIPLSFVVDWFFNVGKTLAAWTPNIGFNTLGSWVTTRSTIFQTSVVTNSTYVLSGYYSKYIPHSAMIGKNQIIKTRRIDPRREVIPRLDIKLDLLKLIDLGIILKNLLH